MKNTYDLSELPWWVSGWAPHNWGPYTSMEVGVPAAVEIPPVPMTVPGSVQGALRQAGVIPDWNVGLNARLCEWVENRHWVLETDIPSAWLSAGSRIRLRCLGLDYSGWIIVNGQRSGEFEGTFMPHEFDLSLFAGCSTENIKLQIVFDCPPRWLGQFGYTSQMTEWKARFNYTWDWVSRLVQLGIWDSIQVEVIPGPELQHVRVTTAADPARKLGAVRLSATVIASPDTAPVADVVKLVLEKDGAVVRSQEFPADQVDHGIGWDDLDVALWYPNGHGEQPLYKLRCQLLAGGSVQDELTRQVGFKQVRWENCRDAPEGADPWLCVVNEKPVFLQGVNWTPILPNFADVTDEDYRRRLELYKRLGLNVLRVWGGACLEKDCFYDECDRLGLLVWQEFPLSSSGIDNWPPEDEKSINDLAEIACSYVRRRQHRVSLLLWCGGNELQGSLDGGKMGCGKPVGLDHPLISKLAEVVARRDPDRRFLASSSSGPRFTAEEADFGKGIHWDVHGPWAPTGGLDEWEAYWAADDSLFRSETGSPGASPADIIRTYSGDCPFIPGTMENALWRRASWWIEWPRFIAEHRREPDSLEEYVEWSQDRQAKALGVAVRKSKERFPGIGGIILWMGHDCFPCMANTAIIDFWGRPKPAALAVGEEFRKAQP